MQQITMRRMGLYLGTVLGVLPLMGCSSESSRETVQEASSPSGAVDSEEGIRIVFLGDSITAANGLDEEEGFVHIVDKRLDSLGIEAIVVNAGISGDTSSGGLSRMDWLLRQGVDILVIELGGNDGLRGIDLSLTRSNLAGMIERTRQADPDIRIILAGMQVPPNLGASYTAEFRNMYPQLAAEYDVDLIPFILDGVGGIPAMNQPDGIHPTAEGHRLVADNVWTVLLPVVREATTP